MCGLEGKLLRLGEEISRRFVVINANSAFFFILFFSKPKSKYFLSATSILLMKTNI